MLKSKADDAKIAAMRVLSVKSGLITISDPSWVHVGAKFGKQKKVTYLADVAEKSRAMKYELTPTHPRYDEFQKAKGKHDDLLK
jgi:hypothetical protein